MADTALIVANNLSHNVLAHIEAAKNSLSHLATVYLVTEVAGQSEMTRTLPEVEMSLMLGPERSL